MKTIVTVTSLETKFWSATICTVAYFLGNGFTVPQPRTIFYLVHTVLYGFTVYIEQNILNSFGVG